MSLNYSLAIQRHPDSLENMRNEIWAAYNHYISTDDTPQHQYCSEEWCKYLKALKDKIPYKHKPALNAEVQELIKPVFEHLSNEELLTRCQVPKHIFVGKEVTEIGVQISLSIFNEARVTFLKMLEHMGCTIGVAAYEYAERKDQERILMAEKATKSATKEGRLARKEAQQQEQEVEEGSGNLFYGPGITD